MLQRRLRAILALLVLCGFLSVTLAAVSSGHMHGAQKPHSCGLCQFNLTPMVAATGGFVLWPPLASGHGVVSAGHRAYFAPDCFFAPSRAPPIA